MDTSATETEDRGPSPCLDLYPFTTYVAWVPPLDDVPGMGPLPGVWSLSHQCSTCKRVFRGDVGELVSHAQEHHAAVVAELAALKERAQRLAAKHGGQA